MLGVGEQGWAKREVTAGNLQVITIYIPYVSPRITQLVPWSEDTYVGQSTRVIQLTKPLSENEGRTLSCTL